MRFVKQHFCAGEVVEALECVFKGWQGYSHVRESSLVCGGLGTFSRGDMPVRVSEFVFVYFLVL